MQEGGSKTERIKLESGRYFRNDGDFWVGITHAMGMGVVETFNLEQGSQSKAKAVCLHQVGQQQQNHRSWVGS